LPAASPRWAAKKLHRIAWTASISVGSAVVTAHRSRFCVRQRGIREPMRFALCTLSILTFCLVGCLGRSAKPYWTTAPSQIGEPLPQPTTYYEHEDHRHLPPGSRIYYLREPGLKGYGEMYVLPGQPGPPGRKPDIQIIK
jgi:hypothetical protein